MVPLTGKYHGNEAPKQMYREFAIGQVSKLPEGNLRVKANTNEACVKLTRMKVKIPGGVFVFKKSNLLGSKHIIDIANIDSDTNTDVILSLGCMPVYETFREINLITEITFATWRIFFLASTCPTALMANGSVCD
ncbi:hypothetical protein Plhal304r1_c030g0096941 [Plasmopara halstedii]